MNLSKDQVNIDNSCSIFSGHGLSQHTILVDWMVDKQKPRLEYNQRGNGRDTISQFEYLFSMFLLFGLKGFLKSFIPCLISHQEVYVE